MNDGLVDHRTADGIDAAGGIDRIKPSALKMYQAAIWPQSIVATLAGGRIVIHVVMIWRTRCCGFLGAPA